MKCHKRETWKNDAGNQIAEPLCIYSPSSLKDVVRIIQQAEQEGLTVRAVGSGHSWSDVAVGSDYLVLPGDLDKIFKTAGDSLLKGDVNTSMLVEFESGVRIRELNKELDKRGLALPNMGGWDEQTYVGAMSTSTHGSGIEFGPLCDIVQSIDIVSDGGVLYRIEPTNGITDRVKYEKKYPPAAGQRKLVQDDDWFNAVKVSVGCMGVIYSLILRVREKFYLKEVRKVSTWNKVKEDLKKGDVLRDNCHYEIIINPYEVKGEHLCLVTTRSDTEKPADLPPDKTNRNFFTELLSSLPFAGDAVKAISDILPDSAPGIINTSIKSLEDDSYINKSYKVFNIGKVNEVKAYSSEIAFPLKGNRYIDAVDKYLEISGHYRKLGKLYLVSPTALRFVKGSDTFLSPQYGRDTCMMEIITVKGSQGAFLLYERYENEFYRYSGRPHWGQINSLSGSHNFIAGMYPKYEAWLDVYHRLNKNGTFDNPFSRRMGFARKTFAPG
jgi:hypothetical protein